MKNLNTVTTSAFSFVSLGRQIERSEGYLRCMGQLDLARTRASNEANLGAVMAYSDAMQNVADAEYLSSRGFPTTALERLAEAQANVLAALRARG